MATADPSIFNALMPRKSAFDYANEFEQQDMRREQQGMARQQNALALEQAQQAQADDRALRNVLSSGLNFDTKEGQAALYKANPKAAPGFLKSRQEAVKAQGEITKLTGENLDAGLSRYRKMLDSVADPQSAVQWLQAQYSDPVVGPVMSKMAPFEEAVKRIPSTPAEFAQWRQKSSMGMEAYQKHVAPATKEIRLGDRVVMVDLNPNSPTFRQQILEQAVGVGPDARLSADTARRGQDLTDARVRESNEIARGAAIADAGGPGQYALVKQFGKPPKDFRWKPDGSAEPIPGGPADLKAGAEGEKRDARRSVLMAQAESVIGTIDEALNLTGWKTAGIGGAAAALPMTDARKLAGNIDTIKANLGFDRLQQMRDMSPTGGALGQVAVQELNSLQSTVAKLDQLQRPSDVRDALEKTRRHYEAWMKTLDGGRTGASATFDAPGPRQPTRGGSSPVKKPSVSNW